jgi:hypothetical protein
MRTSFSINRSGWFRPRWHSSLFTEVYDLSWPKGSAGDQHFTSDGTLIDAWAGMKGFVRKDGQHAKNVTATRDNDPGQLHRKLSG